MIKACPVCGNDKNKQVGPTRWGWRVECDYCQAIDDSEPTPDPLAEYSRLSQEIAEPGAFGESP